MFKRSLKITDYCLQIKKKEFNNFFSAKGMNRKERLKIFNSPERNRNSKNIYQKFPDVSENSTINNDIGDDYNAECVDDSLFTPPDNLLRKIFDNTKRIFSYLKYVIPYGIVFYFTLYYFIFDKHSTNLDTELSDLAKEVDSLKKKNSEMTISAVETPFNLCRIEHCTTLQVNKDDLYKYGFIGFRKSIDPYIIFGENAAPGDCTAFLPKKITFTVKFSKNVKLNNFHIFHPETENKQSAIKDFLLSGFYNEEEFEIGGFTYDINKNNYQSFLFPEIITDRLKITVLNNNGCKKYTTVYKIYAFGVFN